MDDSADELLKKYKILRLSAMYAFLGPEGIKTFIELTQKNIYDMTGERISEEEAGKKFAQGIAGVLATTEYLMARQCPQKMLFQVLLSIINFEGNRDEYIQFVRQTLADAVHDFEHAYEERSGITPEVPSNRGWLLFHLLSEEDKKSLIYTAQELGFPDPERTLHYIAAAVAKEEIQSGPVAKEDLYKIFREALRRDEARIMQELLFKRETELQLKLSGTHLESELMRIIAKKTPLPTEEKVKAIFGSLIVQLVTEEWVNQKTYSDDTIKHRLRQLAKDLPREHIGQSGLGNDKSSGIVH